MFVMIFNVECCIHFQMFKYLVATRMVDNGLLEKGLQYLEQTADGILQNPTRADVSFVSRVYELADRLKYCDPLLADDLDQTRSESTWLYNLKLLFDDFNVSTMQLIIIM